MKQNWQEMEPKKKKKVIAGGVLAVAAAIAIPIAVKKSRAKSRAKAAKAGEDHLKTAARPAAPPLRTAAQRRRRRPRRGQSPCRGVQTSTLLGADSVAHCREASVTTRRYDAAVETARTILIVEDEAELAELLALNLADSGFATEICGNGRDAVDRVAAGSVDLVILDLSLPGLDGVEVCRRIRTQGPWVPILMLTARSSELDRVLGLEVGADDYLTKPFSVRELTARVRAVFRRIEAITAGAEVAEKPLQRGELAIDPVRRQVLAGERELHLTAREFDLLFHFMRHPGRVFSRAQLLDTVWGYGHDGYEHTVNSHINRLRAKLEEDPHSPRWIQTVWGVGYRFVAGETATDDSPARSGGER